MARIKQTDKDLLELKGLHLYHHQGSNCAARIRMALEEKGLKWTGHSINLVTCEHLKPEYLRINPESCVPALIHNGFSITGSEDILRYLEETYPEPSLCTGTEKEKAEIWRWVDEAAHSHLDTTVSFLYAHKMGRPCAKKHLPIYEKINPERARFIKERGYNMSEKQRLEAIAHNHKMFQKLEDNLSRKAYLAGDEFSLADIAWGMNIILLENFGFNFSEYPKVNEWSQKIRQRPAYNDKVRIPKFPQWLIYCMFKIKRFLYRTV
ncbi:thiol:disulfide oxidoreductase [Fulvitalea axinellae]|uniref:Thiol:disulfide oxidoreductase n=1 Tax=Fulvitalea axinellae TaxID=1182444 RepID=A0AAU9CMH5_9BACT|nr:thiol:disulfide oxidoreductase [Fulvitalea axinellae]